MAQFSTIGQSACFEMKPICLTFLAGILLLTGCFKPERPATLASAEGFARLIADQLRQSGTIEESGGGSGQAGNVYTKDFARLLPANSFPPNYLCDAAEIALKKWGEYDTYATRGYGGGDNAFHLDYGGRRWRT
jgi:hypothetical protein